MSSSFALGAQRLSASKIPAAAVAIAWSPLRGQECAQRLSASKIPADRLGARIADNAKYLVLNAFRHQRFLRRLENNLARARREVLNAFRHQRFLRPRAGCKRVPATSVLNAFRHQRFLRRTGSRCKGSRLAECSTPFGIKDSCGGGQRSPRADGAVAGVLNAFRHQRFLRLRGTSRFTGRCAQRLSASKIPADAFVIGGNKYTMCSTPFGIKDSCGAASAAVATAPRTSAQRLSASKIPAADLLRFDDGLGECSTPFGIKDSCGLPVGTGCTGQSRYRVLNAFRHQRFLRIMAAVPVVQEERCSTPFGIKDSCGRNTQTTVNSINSAQRLSASKIPAARTSM